MSDRAEPVSAYAAHAHAGRSGVVTTVLAGVVGGFAGGMIEYPADLIKVRLQTSPQFAGVLDAFRYTVQEHGIRGLYRGVSVPLVGAMADSSIIFWVFNSVKTTLEDLDRPAGLPDTWQRDMGNTAVAGACAGTVVSFWLTPVELIKCRIQSTNSAYQRPADCIRATYRASGLWGFYRGLSGTLMREIPGGAVYFGAYEVGCSTLCYWRGGDRGNMPGLYSLASGSFAGLWYTGAMYPLDCVKSNMQAGASESSARSTFTQEFRRILSTQGVRGLYRGAPLTLCRTVPTNAAVFFGYEQTRKFLEGGFGPLLANET